MQQIERVGVVALLFLVVTIITVAMWDDGTSTDTVRAAQLEDTRTDRNTRREAKPVLREGNDRVRSARARGQLEPTGSRLAMQGDEVRLNTYLGGQRVQDTRGERGRISDSYDPGGILDLPEVSSGTQNPGNQRPRDQNPNAQGSSAQGFGTRGFVTGQPAVYTPEATGKQPRKHLEASAQVPGPRWTYVVKKGDTLERIARHQLGDHRRWTEIQALNGNLDPRKVRLGQKLTMPARRAARGATPRAQQPATTKPREASYRKSTPAPQKTQGGEYYVVQSGDVLGTISLKTLGTSKRWREILDLNPKVDARRLLVGTKLRLPKRGAGTPAPGGPQPGGPQPGGPRVAKNDVRPTPASVRKSGKKGFVVR